MAMASGRSRFTAASCLNRPRKPKKACPGSGSLARLRAAAMRSPSLAVTTASNSSSLEGKWR